MSGDYKMIDICSPAIESRQCRTYELIFFPEAQAKVGVVANHPVKPCFRIVKITNNDALLLLPQVGNRLIIK
jgi:hypothetical protein